MACVERAFRSLKPSQLELRPLFMYSAEHVPGHVFLCMLAYCLERHLRRKLVPLLIEDSERAVTEAQPDSPAQVSPAARSKAASKRTLLEHLGALALNYVTVAQHDQLEFPLVAQPTALQTKAFALLAVDPDKIDSSEMAS